MVSPHLLLEDFLTETSSLQSVVEKPQESYNNFREIETEEIMNVFNESNYSENQHTYMY